ncbi:RNA 2',3'-cyclic phosphodiesterase [Heyndrickxia sp. NPDC080065]|uniref:RNA 2',3'-cyclic phosphodiesterase n=1 Tax=Heyndrickxia sp. NPDC080065 TaxID=3390568 RepID=UPI003D037C70
MSSNHVFFAIPLPQTIKEYLHMSCENLNRDFPFKRWVHREDYHITLAFLGHAEKSQLETAINDIREMIVDTSPFKLQIHGLGTFGRKEAPRIFWAGLLASPELYILREKVYNSCLNAGFQLDTRPFNPHITLARKWDESFCPFSSENLKKITIHPPSFQVNEIVLYETVLEAVPKYHKKAVIHLGD